MLVCFDFNKKVAETRMRNGKHAFKDDHGSGGGLRFLDQGPEAYLQNVTLFA